jgi:hypothetical protein
MVTTEDERAIRHIYQSFEKNMTPYLNVNIPRFIHPQLSQRSIQEGGSFVRMFTEAQFLDLEPKQLHETIRHHVVVVHCGRDYAAKQSLEEGFTLKALSILGNVDEPRCMQGK